MTLDYARSPDTTNDIFAGIQNKTRTLVDASNI